MKHAIKITLLLLGMFFITQLIGLFVISQYSPQISQVADENGTITNVTSYNLPYGMDPPEDVTPQGTLVSIVIAIAIAVFLMLTLMKFKAETILRTWFFIVVTLALGITFNSLLLNFPYSPLIALIIALPIAIFKIFKRNIIVHNISELLIYPGIASIFVVLFNFTDKALSSGKYFGKLYEYFGLSASAWSIIAISAILILISLYDMYAVWHAGFMQKMAKYQIEKVKIFTGFFVPYLGQKERDQLAKAKLSKNKNKKVKVSLAILGGGDVVFPLILAGVVFNHWGLLQALIVSLFSTIALAFLFYISEKGKFYPAMPFITVGAFIGLAIAYLI